MKSFLILPVILALGAPALVAAEEDQSQDPLAEPEAAADADLYSLSGSSSLPPGGHPKLSDFSWRSDILDEDGNPVDLSPFSIEEQHWIVREYRSKLSPQERVRRFKLRYEHLFQQGRIDELSYLRLVHPESFCEYGPTQAPRGMTAERLREIMVQTQRLPPLLQYEVIMAEPPRDPAPGEDPPKAISFSIPAPKDPDCLARKRRDGAER